MIKFVLGPSGSGKTMWLIERANQDKKEGNGNIVFIDTDDSHIFSLDHGVRLINAANFDITTEDRLFGFLAGILSRDYDIEKIYIDGIYDIIDFDMDEFVNLVHQLKELGDEHDAVFLMGLDKKLEELPEDLREYAEVLEGQE